MPTHHKRTLDFGSRGADPKGTRNLKLKVAKKLENLMKNEHISGPDENICLNANTKKKKNK